MSVRSVAVDKDGFALGVLKSAGAPGRITRVGAIPITATVGLSFGTFAAQTRTTTGTTIIIAPEGGGSIIITWIVVSGEKQAGSDVTVRFTDGSDTVTLMVINQVDAPPNLSIAFPSRVQGWRDARVEMVTSGAGDATVSVGYVKVPQGLVFSDWDALR